MTRRSRVSLAFGAAIVIAVASIAIGLWYRSRLVSSAELMRRLPSYDALLLSIDFEALRGDGILQLLVGPKSGVDPEYQEFARQIHLDYRKDLDLAVAAFAPTGTFMLVKGRFDWKGLRSYVESHGGRCDESLCRIIGSRPERHISFFPLQSNVMALAVSADSSAALRLNAYQPGAPPEPPGAPVWLSMPASILRSRDRLPAGTLMFADSISRAESLTLAFAPEGSRVAARLNVRCDTEQDATQIAADLTKTTNLLRSMITREHQQPNPADLSGVLVAGAFRSEGRRVVGYWPIEQAFVKSVLGGT